MKEIKTHGIGPPSIQSHSANLVCGNKIVVFGGEMMSNTAMNDTYIFCMDSFIWEKLEFETCLKPPKRRLHASCSSNKTVFMHGG